MTRDRAINLIGGAVAIAIIVWIARHTYWAETTVSTMPRGEAAANPYYAIEHLAHELGVRTREIASLRVPPPPNGALYIENLSSDFLHNRVDSLESWVRSGGRLILVGTNPRSSTLLRSWTGIAPAARAKDPAPKPAIRVPVFGLAPDADCESMVEKTDGVPEVLPLRVCPRYAAPSFDSKRVPAWSLSDDKGVHLLRVNIGRGSVTAVGTGALFNNWSLLRHDHARILILAARLKRGDEVSILSPWRAEPLTAMLWRLAGPAVAFFAAAAALLILRNLPRFGPPAPMPLPVRRSLAEQIRANARFAWRTRRLGSLRSAVSRALDETARIRIAAYGALNVRGRTDAIAARTGTSPEALNAAMTEADAGPNGRLAAIALLEQTRRILNIPVPGRQGADHER